MTKFSYFTLNYIQSIQDTRLGTFLTRFLKALGLEQDSGVFSIFFRGRMTRILAYKVVGGYNNDIIIHVFKEPRGRICPDIRPWNLRSSINY